MGPVEGAAVAGRGIAKAVDAEIAELKAVVQRDIWTIDNATRNTTEDLGRRLNDVVERLLKLEKIHECVFSNHNHAEFVPHGVIERRVAKWAICRDFEIFGKEDGFMQIESYCDVLSRADIVWFDTLSEAQYAIDMLKLGDCTPLLLDVKSLKAFGDG